MKAMKIQIFVCTVVTLLKFYQATTMIIIYPDIEQRFIQAKDPEVYDIDDDPFDTMPIDERIKTCDKVIFAPTYMWHEKGEDLSKFNGLPITENYQRKSKLNAEVDDELNISDPIGIKFKNHEAVPFKRIFCSVYEKPNEELYQELYISYGKEPHYPFVLARNNGKDEPLIVIGILDDNEVTVTMGSSGSLVKRLSAHPISICTIKDEGTKFEICSRVHDELFIQVKDDDDDNYTPNVYNWSDNSENDCNVKDVVVDEQNTETLPVESLKCTFNECDSTDHVDVFVALKKIEGDKVSVAIMISEKNVDDEATSHLLVRGSIEFVRH